MTGIWLKRGIGAIIVLLIVGALVYAMWPQPVAVDVAAIARGPLDVTVDDEGQAEIRDIFRVSAPISGQLDRLPVHVGDEVSASVTEVASIRPTDPAFLDVRTRRELEAAADAARAAVALAAAQVKSAEATQASAQADADRSTRLAKLGTISSSAFEKTLTDLDTAKAAVEQAKATLQLRQSELSSAQARLIEPGQNNTSDAACCLSVKAPVSGTVIKLISENEQVVTAGTPLLEIGNPRDLEIVAPLLSSDAVNISPGMKATIDGWGGPALDARVLSIDPAAYTKTSALGIEEQRVDATLEILSNGKKWLGLGHDFRVDVHIITWHGDDVVLVPLAALFRSGSQWTVYRIVDGRAVATPITIDHRNNAFAEATAGLAAGDTVVLHPSDRIGDGVRLAKREG